MPQHHSHPKIAFEDLLAEFTSRVRQNEHPDVEEYCGLYPQHREQIEELFPVIACLESTKKNASQSAEAARWKLPHLSRLGEYELIREIGRGGMGIVYEARQPSLDRRVALKVLPPVRALTENGLARFQREARMSARLHHSNIVPILGTGQADGTHFIAMQLIDGVGLEKIIEVLRRRGRGEVGSITDAEPDVGNAEISIADFVFPLDQSNETRWRVITKIGLQAARALTHSHEKHVVHRDIKPSNLIIDRHGKTWVADFGLARSFEGVPGDDITRDVGTPRYMAPEQALGSTTSQSDIYSLGLTLYELATGQPVFEEGSGENESNFRKRKQEPLPRLASMVPAIPQDLERILMKCLSIEPRNRYEDAGGLAEDLERFLDHRPLANVKTPPWIRARRWSQRNPHAALATALALVCLAGIVMVSFSSYWKTRSQLQKIESTLQVSVDTLDKVYDRLSPVGDSVSASTKPWTGDSQRPFLSDHNARLMTELLSSYDKLAQLDSSNRDIRLATAKANFRVGEIHRQLGNSSQAQVALNHSIELLRKLTSEKVVSQNETCLPIARALISLGSTRNKSGLLTRHYLEKAMVVIANSADSEDLSESTRLDLRYEKARTLFLLGIVPKRRPNNFPANPSVEGTAKPADREYLSRSIDILEQWSPPFPARITDLLSLGYGERSTRFNDADSNRAIELLEDLVQQFPNTPQFRANLAGLYSEADPLTLQLSEFPEAARRIRQALRICENLDLNERRIRGIVKHAHHKMALMMGRVHRDADGLNPLDIERILGNRSRNALDEAVRHARQSVELQIPRAVPKGDGNGDRKGNGVGNDTGKRPVSAGNLGWALRFNITLCELLWERNRGNDRDEVEAIVDQSLLDVGPIDSATQDGRMLSEILEQLAGIRVQSDD